MYNFAPQNYICPLCIPAQGLENEHAMAKQADIFYRDDLVFAMVNSKFIPGNEGHVILCPLAHYENIFDLPAEVESRIMEVAKRISIALKEVRKCDGVTLKQLNGPAAGQHAFHYHMHIIPRFTGDDYNKQQAQTYVAPLEERKNYADALRSHLARQNIG